MLRLFNLHAAAVLTIALTPAHGASVLNSVAPPGVIFELLALNRDLPTVANPKYLSPTDLVASPDSTKLYVAEQTAKRIDVIDMATNTVTKRISLPNEVTGLAVAPDGLKLYATCSSDHWPAGMVCEVDASSGKVTRRMGASHGARSPVMNPDGKTLYVCNLFNNDVSVIDITGGKEIGRIPVIRQPYCAGITPDGTVLVVANALPAEKSTDTGNIACKISLVTTATRKVTDTIALPRGSHSTFGLAISPDGNHAFVTHLIGEFTIPAVLVEGGWVHRNNCAIIDIKGRKLLNDVCLDDATMGSANPWKIACTGDASILCIVHSGSNDLSVINLQQMMTKVDVSESLDHNFTTLVGIINRWVPVIGKAPKTLAIIGNKLYTAGYYADNIEIFDLSPPPAPDHPPGVTASGTITLGPSQPFTSKRKGEYHFYDARICLLKWQSCHSCHPLTRPDAMNWGLLGANYLAKNTPSMLYSWWTPPTSWAGKQKNAYESIRAHIRSELFMEPDEKIAVCIDTFFMNMKPVPSPYLVKGELSKAARRGKTIFTNTTKVNCSDCHPGPLCTDNQFHNTGVPDPWDNLRVWNTPTLIEVWRTAPYGHLGSFDKIEDMLKLKTHCNAGDWGENDFKDLLEYVLSL
jgi:YVTN family beta-propeller protein